MEALAHVTRLQKRVLSWDLFRLVEGSEGRGDDEAVGACGEKLPEVKQTYSSVEDYLATFTPLLLEECAAQILRQEEGDSGRAHPAVISVAEQKSDFLIVRVMVEHGVTADFVDNDVVVLTKDNPDTEDGWDGINPHLHCLGQVEGSEGQGTVRLRLHLQEEGFLSNPEQLTRVKAMRTGIQTERSCWYMKKLTNLSTITREWVALQSVGRLPFVRDLMSAKVGEKRARPLVIPVPMMEVMKKTYNSSQMMAIQSGLGGCAINLVQGPPGTGKTKTILGLLSIIMHSVPPSYSAFLNKAVGEDGRLCEEDAHRLWMKMSPFLMGKPNKRDAKPTKADFALHGNPTGDVTYGLGRAATPKQLKKEMSRKNHVLVCAPSNSALDEIVGRIMNSGLMDQEGRMYTPSVVRIGVNVHHSVRSVSLDELVNHRLAASGQSSGSQNRTEWDRLRLAILDEADIVASTLSFSGSHMFARMSRRFDVVVIDEAAQAVEPATFIPLVNGCHQVFLIGDPVQLPATVISQRASDLGYDTSLFKRLQTAGYPVTMLDTQYRMHPEISVFPSTQFYAGSLKNGPNVATETVRDWHKHGCFGPFAFFNMDSMESVPEGSTSVVNEQEAAFVLSICGELMSRWPHLRTTPAIAVISPYKAQVKLIREKFKAAMGSEAAKMVDINTIDGFQGREKDVAIFSAVRGHSKEEQGFRGIGFVADERRLNVGLTRARATMLVVGNADTLVSDPNWGPLIKGARNRGCMYKVDAPYSDFISKIISGEVNPVPKMREEAEARKNLKGGRGGGLGGKRKADAGLDDVLDEFELSDGEGPPASARRGKRAAAGGTRGAKAKRGKK